MTQPRVVIFKDAEELSRAAAEQFVAIGRQAVNEHNSYIVSLAGGATPQRTYQLLAEPPYRESVPWSETIIYFGDERCVPPDDRASNFFQADRALLSKVPLTAPHIHRIDGTMDPRVAAEDYAQHLGALKMGGLPWPRFDLVLLGLGRDAHTASLFPGSISRAELTQPVMAVSMEYELGTVHRVSLTPMVFNSARNIIFLVSGAQKADALAGVLEGEVDLEKLPAQRISPTSGTVTWMVDEAAAAKLKQRRT